MLEIIFTKNAHNFEKGAIRKFDPIVAKGLVVDQKVARYTNPDIQKDAAKEIKRLAKLEGERIAKEKALKEKADERYKKIADERKERLKASKEATANRFVAERDTRIDDFKNKAEVEKAAKKLLEEKDAFEKEKAEFLKLKEQKEK